MSYDSIICNNCGKAIPDDSVYCQYCGVKLDTITTKVTEADVESLYAEGDECYYSHQYEKAFECYLKAAKYGHILAQYSLGEMYYYGNGVEENYEEAFAWYLKAATKGDEDAQYSLGYMYENGEGVDQDYKKAFEWYIKAAEQGQLDAQLCLGSLYESGEGASIDIAKAKYWYEKAADQGDQAAEEALERLTKTKSDVRVNYILPDGSSIWVTEEGAANLAKMTPEEWAEVEERKRKANEELLKVLKKYYPDQDK